MSKFAVALVFFACLIGAVSLAPGQDANRQIRPRPGGGGRPGETNTPPARGERIQDKLVVGDQAPDFTLPLVSGKASLTLSSFRDKRPVVLIFASYT